MKLADLAVDDDRTPYHSFLSAVTQHIAMNLIKRLLRIVQNPNVVLCDPNIFPFLLHLVMWTAVYTSWMAGKHPL